LFSIGKNLPNGKYIADIGFDIRKDASGGGAVINLKMIKILAKIGMEIYLSEYPKAN
jgi:selenophosphate synthetase-related protein